MIQGRLLILQTWWNRREVVSVVQLHPSGFKTALTIPGAGIALPAQLACQLFLLLGRTAGKPRFQVSGTDASSTAGGRGTWRSRTATRSRTECVASRGSQVFQVLGFPKSRHGETPARPGQRATPDSRDQQGAHLSCRYLRTHTPTSSDRLTVTRVNFPPSSPSLLRRPEV